MQCVHVFTIHAHSLVTASALRFMTLDIIPAGIRTCTVTILRLRMDMTMAIIIIIIMDTDTDIVTTSTCKRDTLSLLACSHC